MDARVPVGRRTLLAGAVGALGLLAACGDAQAARPGRRALTPVPALCYHHVRDWGPSDKPFDRQFLICPPAALDTHLVALADAGWTAISPDQHLAHVRDGAPLPAKPVLLSFDDSQATQVTSALPALVRHGTTATFFALTKVLGGLGWLTEDDLRRIDAAGMTVAAHTWDHRRIDRYAEADWDAQLAAPKEQLERVVGKPVVHFAYPNGTWFPEAVRRVEAAGYRTAYQLADQPVDPAAPALTLRRLLAQGTWDGPALLAALEAEAAVQRG